METRLATKGDVPRFAALHAESFGAARWTHAQIAESLALNTTLALVAEEDGEAQGFILCQIVGDEAEILTFCVDPKARRKGAGRQLLDAALGKARRQEVWRMFLEVAADNTAALALYGKAGFSMTGRRPGYYAHDGNPVDAVMMTAALAAL